jgi:hypothetical protein
MDDITLTALRKSLFRVADRVFATDAPVSIRHGTRVLTLSANPSRTKPSRLERLKQRDLISGDAKGRWKVKPSRSHVHSQRLGIGLLP